MNRVAGPAAEFGGGEDVLFSPMVDPGALRRNRPLQFVVGVSQLNIRQMVAFLWGWAGPVEKHPD